MFVFHGQTVRMTRGDFGSPLFLHIIEHCKEQDEILMGTDIIRAEIQRQGEPLVVREALVKDLQHDEGLMELSLTQAESDSMTPGRYALRVFVTRDGEAKTEILTTILEVIL